VPGIPFVGLDPLSPRVEEVMLQILVKDTNVGELTHGIGAMGPHQPPPQDADAQLIAKCDEYLL
jgi:hypothetical protein